jgi:P27 family predicted phage terminase small subunit
MDFPWRRIIRGIGRRFPMGKRGPTPGGKVAAVPAKLPERPRPPSGMTPRARARWREVVKGYAVDHFRAGDLPLLRAYCEAHDRAVRAEEALAKDGDYIEGALGGLKAHPACAVKIAAESLMAQLATKLRLCANSRIDKHKAGKEKAEPHSKRAGLMFGGGGA